MRCFYGIAKYGHLASHLKIEDDKDDRIICSVI